VDDFLRGDMDIARMASNHLNERARNFLGSHRSRKHNSSICVRFCTRSSMKPRQASTPKSTRFLSTSTTRILLVREERVMFIPDWLLNAPNASGNPADDPTRDWGHAILAAHAMKHHINERQLAAAYDAYHDAKDSNALRQSLGMIALPAETVGALLRAKQITDPVVEPVDRVVGALNTMAKMDPQVLSTAEKYPTAAKALVDAATHED
jgi:hypothetical protein